MIEKFILLLDENTLIASCWKNNPDILQLLFDSIAVSVFVVILVDFEKYKSETSRLKEYPPEILGGAITSSGR